MVFAQQFDGCTRRPLGLRDLVKPFEACGQDLRLVAAVGLSLTFNLDALFFTALGVRLSRVAMYPSERGC